MADLGNTRMAVISSRMTPQAMPSTRCMADQTCDLTLMAEPDMASTLQQDRPMPCPAPAVSQTPVKEKSPVCNSRHAKGSLPEAKMHLAAYSDG